MVSRSISCDLYLIMAIGFFGQYQQTRELLLSKWCSKCSKVVRRGNSCKVVIFTYFKNVTSISPHCYLSAELNKLDYVLLLFSGPSRFSLSITVTLKLNVTGQLSHDECQEAGNNCILYSWDASPNADPNCVCFGATTGIVCIYNSFVILKNVYPFQSCFSFLFRTVLLEQIHGLAFFIGSMIIN